MTRETKTYIITGAGGVGVDAIVASFVDPDTMETIYSNTALKFWDETAKKSPRCAKVVSILKDYVATMEAARAPTVRTPCA